MDKNKICEALYASSKGAVVRRRKSIGMPAVMLIAGAALIGLNNIFSSALSDDVRSALVFVGGVVAIFGLIMLLARLLSSSGAPYHTASKKYLRYEELFFDRKEWQEVSQCIRDGEIARLRTLKTSSVPAVSVALYATPGDGFTAAQAYEYTDLEYRPLTEIQIASKG